MNREKYRGMEQFNNRQDLFQIVANWPIIGMLNNLNKKFIIIVYFIHWRTNRQVYKLDL